MGIRVHKMLGYGLADLEPGERPRDGRADPRINWEASIVLWEGTSGQEYFRWLEHRRIQDKRDFRFSLDWAYLKHDQGALGTDLRDCVAYEPEFGLPEVLVIRPLSYSDWFRSDDTLDYMAETYPWRPQSQKSRVEVYEHGIFPFNGSYMDKRTGERVDQKVMYWIRARSDIQQVPGGTVGERLSVLDALAQEFTPFSTHAEADENIVPLVPEEIRDLAEFGGVFTVPDVSLQLRPMLYTYWG